MTPITKLIIGNTAVLDLTAYAKTADVTTAIAGITKLTIQKTSSLPATGTENIIYLVPKPSGSGDNIHDEYMWINNKWELIGSTNIDLTPYAKTADVTTSITTAKTETINTASADATTKANNAKTAAVSESKTYADGKFLKPVTLSQAAYNSLPAKDPLTLYLIND